ncbi:MAG TPA: beta-N-acetylhexosaminidase [Nitrospiria bacterium]|jgi:beta-N-acetylhexosaminidase|nr:beta-N-acetylhexosaminidase [Nitrospiria bacterium]
MTLKEKIGQLFMLGFEGRSPSKAVVRLIREFQIGGVILFARNLQSPSQAARLCNALQAQAPKMPMLVSIDQEGGRVSRLPKGFTVFPGGAQLAACHSTELVYRVAQATARELRAVGINMNMAPVLDVNTNPANPVIGDRAFGASPTLVSSMGLTTMAGLQDNRVIACGKHFPGHGDTAADSHKELPRVPHDLQRLREVELRPFLHIIPNGLASIMTAHVLYPKLDPDEPATLSKKIITGLLREAMGFKGVVVTDDLEMAAISDRHGPGEAAVKAIEAGADLILFCRDEDKQREALEAVANAVKHKKISEARIEQSLLRILQMKEKFILPYQPADLAQIKEIVGSSSHKHLLEEVKERAEAPEAVKAG